MFCGSKNAPLARGGWVGLGYLVATSRPMLPCKYRKNGAALLALCGVAACMAAIICAPVALPPFAAMQAAVACHWAALLCVPAPMRAYCPPFAFLVNVNTVLACGLFGAVGAVTTFGVAMLFTPLGLQGRIIAAHAKYYTGAYVYVNQ